MADNNKYLNMEGLNHFARGVYKMKANVESPAFSGTPTAPTATSGTSNSQIATTEFVAGEIANIGTASDSSSGLMSSSDKIKLDKLQHTLTFGKYTYDGTQDVLVDIYNGDYDI